jgi:dihydrofolate reductase
MAKIIAGMTMSLDGFVHDAGGSADALFRDLADWRKTERGKASIAATGAVMMGRRAFEMAADPDSYADHYEYQVPIFVLTRHPPARHPKESSGLTFTFVGDGLNSAIAQAKTAAKGRQVTVVGGTALIQALLRAGAVDELEIDIMPVLLHGGLRLFENLGEKEIGLERISVDALSHGRTAIRFVVRH